MLRLKWIARLLGFVGAVVCISGLSFATAHAQKAENAVLGGFVTDSTGALIPGAFLHLSPLRSHDAGFQQRTDGSGAFTFTVPPGRYALTAEAVGFAVFTKRLLTLQPAEHQGINVRMLVASGHEEISINAGDGEGAGADDVAGSLSLAGDSLKLLSNDPSTLQQQLQALAGSSGTPHFLIDGFSGGRLPPKSSIRAIRIGRNDYSAAYAELGFARIEIDTKPGTDQLHGSFFLSGTDQPLDAYNPYSTVHPPFYEFEQEGNLSGPVGRRSSFNFNERSDHLANSAVINAADPAAPSVLLSTSLAAPQRTETFSLRLDRQISSSNVAYIRDEWTQTLITNSGILPLVLPEAAFSSDLETNTLQLADTQMIGTHAVNETRFQYLRTRLQQNPVSTLPSILVEGTFQSGGSPSQFLRDNQDAFEAQDRFEWEHGKHVFRAGFRFRSLRDANTATAGFNGQYIFPDVASYLAGQPTQYSQTVGQTGVALLTNDAGLYAEDDWKLTPNLTLSYGVRFESQSAIPDHSDPAPRVAFAWAVRPGKRRTPWVTLRGGYGIFYTRFPATQLLASVRQNGSRQVAYVTPLPDFNPDGPPANALASAGQPTIFQVNPALRSSYTQVASLAASRTLGRFGSVSGTLLYGHDTHGFLTRNSNAPLPGTFAPGDPTGGVRPLGSATNVYQFASSANGNLETFRLNYRLHLSANLSAFGVFMANKNYDETDGIDHFTANPYNIRQDYGRSALSQAQQYTGGFQWTLPFGVQVTPFLVAHAGVPFDITTGTDLNGDTVFNDRPAFATDPTRKSVVATGYGSFDVQPTAGQPLVPRNYATSPGFVWLQLQAGKDIHLGPRPAAPAATEGKPVVQDRPWVLHFGVEVHNLTNHNNPGVPVGALAASPCTAISCGCGTGSITCPLAPSPYFGRSLSLADQFSPNTASNRTVFLQTTFSW